MPRGSGDSRHGGRGGGGGRRDPGDQGGRGAGAGARAAAPALTERQEARRRRILRTSARPAARGGFDAVQMREVAQEAQVAQVALGTLYRCFPSEVHPLVATMQDRSVRTPRSRTAAGGAHRRGARGADPAAALRALRREPLPAEATVRSVTFADRSVRPEAERISRRTTAIILDATGLADPTPERLRAVRVVEHPLH